MQIQKNRTLEDGMGIHAFKDRKTAEENNCGHVLGTVEMWGDIVEHEKGYRSEWAKIKSLEYVRWYLLNPVDPRLVKLRQIYGLSP